MRVLVIGTGGREHALVAALSADPDVDELIAAPGNPGIGLLAKRLPIDQTDPAAVAALAMDIHADLVVVGPEAPLVAGVADAVCDVGIPCFGPSKAAARIEGSKAFAKDVMAVAGVATARARVCTSAGEASAALDMFGSPYVVKQDGLAAGKGVLVTNDRAAAMAHATACDRVVVEEYLDGRELSMFVITDGDAVVPLPLAQDYKRLLDGDEGPNTGGMGAYAPIGWAPADLVPHVMTAVVRPVLAELQNRNSSFSGLLYVGLTLTDAGPKVIEFNCRFGDPEAQALLPLLRSGLGGLLYAAATDKVASCPPPVWREAAAVSVVIASAGYPAAGSQGDVIGGVGDGPEYIHAGTAVNEAGQLVTAGGRAICCTAVAQTLAQAREDAYALAATIDLPGAVFRTDIGAL